MENEGGRVEGMSLSLEQETDGTKITKMFANRIIYQGVGKSVEIQ